MEKETECTNCNEEVIITENSLFYSEEKIDSNIICPECNEKITTLKTDGWFFVRTKTEFFKEIEIEKAKPRLAQLIP
jgi:DNA-directed RNA polymerase subunit RPC12/RpoP